MKAGEGLGRAEIEQRVCAVLDLAEPPVAGQPLHLRPLATAVRFAADELRVPAHLLHARPHVRLYFALGAAAQPQLPALLEAGTLRLLGPLSELRMRWGERQRSASIRLGEAAGAGPPPPRPIALSPGMPSLVAGFPLGGALLVLGGSVLASPPTDAFDGLRRGDQRIQPGMSGSPVFARDAQGWGLAGMVLGASQPDGSPGAGDAPWAGARILEFFPRGEGEMRARSRLVP